jgi:CRISPR-associated protein Csb1
MTTMLTTDLFEGVNAITVSSRLELLNSNEQARVLLYPPTYMEGTYESKHVISRPDPNGISSHVLIDSVQSEARRISKYYQDIEGMPDIYVVMGEQIYSATADLAHRAYDALLRDSLLDDIPWTQTEIGVQLGSSSIRNATALYQHAPAMLLFGGWDSHTGKSSPFRIARSITSEIWASNGEVMTRVATKGSPVVVRKDEQVYLSEDHILQTGEAPEGTKQKNPSDIGLGTVPSRPEPKGIIVDADSIMLNGSLSLARLNRYRFPINGDNDPEGDKAARNVLACLGLYMLTMHLESGLDLRSGCDLEMVEWSWVIRQGLNGKVPIEVDSNIMRGLLSKAINRAEELGLAFADSISLQASPALESVVSR